MLTPAIMREYFGEMVEKNEASPITKKGVRLRNMRPPYDSPPHHPDQLANTMLWMMNRMMPEWPMKCFFLASSHSP